MTISVRSPRFATLGAYSMFDNKFNQYRPEVCPEIGKIMDIRVTIMFCPYAKMTGG